MIENDMVYNEIEKWRTILRKKTIAKKNKSDIYRTLYFM